jgi:lipopolysaccharide/colanic/teichoic acid biosynthesis glycosyltransferase
MEAPHGAGGGTVIEMTYTVMERTVSNTKTIAGAPKPPRSAEPFEFDRLGELALAGLILLVAAPVLIVVAMMIWAEDGGPVFFSQSRIGRGGKHFRCYKLRTMSIDAAPRLARLLESSEESREEWARDHKLKNDPRITRLGRFLRKTSIDEFPQMLNVIRGDMSLVGPRPIVDSEVGRYGRRFKAYCTVRPGITGLWQVKGRNDVSYRRRVAIDTIYCANKSLGLDIRIVAATVPVVLFRRGSY